MYAESVSWYFNRLARFNTSLQLESNNPGDCRRYNVTNNGYNVSPTLKARDMKIWLDAYYTGLKETACIVITHPPEKCQCCRVADATEAVESYSVRPEARYVCSKCVKGYLERPNWRYVGEISA